MKRNILYLVAVMMVWMFASCQDDLNVYSKENPKVLTLEVEIEQMGGGLETDTRAIIVPPLEGELDVNDLYLLFFKEASNGSANFESYYEVPPGTNGLVAVNTPMELNYNKINSGDYTILAFANTEQFNVNSLSGDFDTFLNSLSPNDLMEDVINDTQLFVNSLTDPSETFDEKCLFMSGRTEKKSGQNLITLKLTRALCRIDLELKDNNYVFNSGGIYNYAQNTSLWLSSGAYSKPSIGELFYERNLPTDPINQGAFYAFENFVANPKYGDKTTTCLILGFKPTTGQVKYYRINLNPKASGQSLKRNHVYKVTINSILGNGSSTPNEAYEATSEPQLDYNINNWSTIDEGIIVSDGTNTLAIPSKTIRFTKEGGMRTDDIFTVGEGTLTMSVNLPNELSASLSGNKLTVNAQPLGDFLRREGTITLNYAGLKGTIIIIQEPEETEFIRVDKTLITNYPADGSTTYTEDITVTSSGEWNAKIYPSGSSFSFDAGSDTKEIYNKQSGQIINVFARDRNPQNRTLTGFILLSLKDNPGVNRVIMLKQNSSWIGYDLDGQNEIIFTSYGLAEAYPNQEYHQFIVKIIPSVDENGQVNTDWNAVIENGNNLFDLEIDKTLNNEKIIVKKNWPYNNLKTQEFIANLKIYPGNNSQSPDAINITIRMRASEYETWSERFDFNVNGEEKPILLANTGDWEAIIESVNTEDNPGGDWFWYNFGNIEHSGYVIVDGSSGRITGKGVDFSGTGNISFKTGFPAIPSPLVGVNPTLTIKIYRPAPDSRHLGTIWAVQEKR